MDHYEHTLKRIDRTVTVMATEAMRLLDEQVYPQGDGDGGTAIYGTDEETLQKVRALLFSIQLLTGEGQL